MKRRILLAVGFAALTAASAPQPIDLPGEKLHPESISITPDGTAYVGSLSGGVLRVAMKTGKVERWQAPGAFGSGAQFGVFADTVNKLVWTCTNDFTARGLTVPGSDPGSVLKAFDMATGQGKVSLRMPGDKPVCNDFAVARDGTVYVTDTSSPQLLRWKKGAAALEVWVTDPVLGAGIDGIAILGDGNVYVNNVRSSELFRVNVERDGRAGTVTRLVPSMPLKGPDGMRAVGPDRLAIAGGGRIDLVTIKGDAAEVRTLKDGIKGPTGVATYGGTIWYSQGQNSALFNPAAAGALDPFRLTPLPLPN